tara:strand:- start:5532 stop:6383 length:852 start_codon:yes stop_codon:yes gene_type:complete
MEPSSRDDFVIAIRSAFLKKDTKQKFSLLALILLTLTILIFARYDFRFVKFAKTSLNEIAYRSTFIFSAPENFVKTTYTETKNILFVYNKNKILEEKVKELDSKILETNYIISENERLKKTIDDISYLSDEILAKVIVDKQSPFLKSIILNKGSKHGAKLGMAVLDEKYLVGKIVEVNFTTSRVLLLSDLNSKIPVDIMPNGTLSILSGTGLNHGIIQYVRDQELIENDQTVYTSGAGGLFKSGIPVGKIEKNLTDNKLKVNFYSDYSQLRYVKLVSFKTEEE